MKTKDFLKKHEACCERGDDGELDTMTGVDPDGSIWQTTKLEEDE